VDVKKSQQTTSAIPQYKSSGEVILQVEGIAKNFGGLNALEQVDFNIRDGEILGLIGPNGAGKTTMINVISGFFPPSSGKVIFRGKNIAGTKAPKIAGLGIGRTFQASNLFMDLSALENVFTGCHMSYRTNVFKRVLRFPSARQEESNLRKKAEDILEFMGLGQLKNELARNLPHGHQRILGICMALATSPKLLLLDEPMTGMNAVEVETMMDLIRQIRNRDITIIMIEHNMDTVMNLCDRIVVLNYGQKIAEGNPEEIQVNEDVIDAYLGKE
jgi:branched-chain amino acid transport system ATP-binding protein